MALPAPVRINCMHKRRGIRSVCHTNDAIGKHENKRCWKLSCVAAASLVTTSNQYTLKGQPVNCLMRLIPAAILNAQLLSTPPSVQAGEVKCSHDHLFLTDRTEPSDSLCLRTFLRLSARQLYENLR